MNFKKFSPWRWLTRKMSSNSDRIPVTHRPTKRDGILTRIRRGMGRENSPKAYHYTVDLPGLSKSDISLALVRDHLVLRAESHREVREERNGIWISQRSSGMFHRSVQLPWDADRNAIKARFKNGALTITIPKKRQKEPKTGQIRITYA